MEKSTRSRTCRASTTTTFAILTQSQNPCWRECTLWWKQGNYRFRFDADGDHFRIWVSDDQRPEEVELEGRSTGLQWFLSFYLVFLVESKDSHQGAILLLDEPGLSLHPMAQQDLSLFFDNLSQTNQLLYTTHSPFLVDADRLDRARKVYVADDGTSKATSDLQAPSTSNKTQKAAAYTVFAAMGLTVAESLLLGCKPVIVEGISDQYYLSAIKSHLIKLGRIKPERELIFPPAGGVKGVKAAAGVLSARDDQLPTVLLDGDAAGIQGATQLKESLYVGQEDAVITIDRFVATPNAEIEDLLPPHIIARAVDAVYRHADIPFSDAWKAAIPIVTQIEVWATKNQIALTRGWKVEVAKRAKQKILDGEMIEEGLLSIWTNLFDKLSQ